MPQDNSIPLRGFQGESPVDNYLTAYTQSKQMQRQGQADARANVLAGQQDQQFQWQQEAHNVQDQERKAQVVADALAMARPGDAQGFEAIKQRLVQQGAIDAQTAAQYDITRLPELQAKSKQWMDMKKFQMDQRVGESGLQTAAANRGLIGAQTDAAKANAEFIRSGKGMSGGRPLTSPMNKEFGTLGDQLSQVSKSAASFKDEYASRGILGIGGSLVNAADRTLVGSDASTWWQNYDRYRNVVRNDLFGASLTSSEQAAFDSADITPGMNAETVKKNLKLQQDIIEGSLGRRARSAVASGYNRESIMELTGLGGDSSAPPPPSGGPKEGDTATSKSGKAIVFRGGKWNYR